MLYQVVGTLALSSVLLYQLGKYPEQKTKSVPNFSQMNLTFSYQIANDSSLVGFVVGEF